MSRMVAELSPPEFVVLEVHRKVEGTMHWRTNSAAKVGIFS